jgi:hypothetical protein
LAVVAVHRPHEGGAKLGEVLLRHPLWTSPDGGLSFAWEKLGPLGGLLLWASSNSAANCLRPFAALPPPVLVGRERRDMAAG